MRIVLAVAAALGLTGCADSQFVEHPVTSLFPSLAADEPAPAPATDHCRTLAKLRAGDAAYEGEDSKTQRSVYERTYADCVAWDARHNS